MPVYPSIPHPVLWAPIFNHRREAPLISSPPRLKSMTGIGASVVLSTWQIIRHPSLVATIPVLYRHGTWSNWDAREPWWNPRAIQHLKQNLPAEGLAFEWGSGGSTVWLSDNGLKVTAIESEQVWADKVRLRCPDADIRFVPGTKRGDHRSEPQLRDRGRHFFDEYITAIDEFPAATFDVIIVDGVCRMECARRAIDKIKPDGIIVLDDTNWDFLRVVSRIFAGWDSLTLSGFKPKSGLGIWSTTFFWRPKGP
jgi:hypothetical protein